MTTRESKQMKGRKYDKRKKSPDFVTGRDYLESSTTKMFGSESAQASESLWETNNHFKSMQQGQVLYRDVGVSGLVFPTWGFSILNYLKSRFKIQKAFQVFDSDY